MPERPGAILLRACLACVRLCRYVPLTAQWNLDAEVEGLALCFSLDKLVPVHSPVTQMICS